MRSGRISSGGFFPPVLVLLRKIVGVKCLSPFGAGALSTGEDAFEARASSAVLLDLFLWDARVRVARVPEVDLSYGSVQML